MRDCECIEKIPRWLLLCGPDAPRGCKTMVVWPTVRTLRWFCEQRVNRSKDRWANVPASIQHVCWSLQIASPQVELEGPGGKTIHCVCVEAKLVHHDCSVCVWKLNYFIMAAVHASPVFCIASRSWRPWWKRKMQATNSKPPSISILFAHQ